VWEQRGRKKRYFVKSIKSEASDYAVSSGILLLLYCYSSLQRTSVLISLKLRDQVPHPYTTIGIVTGLYIS
jgi:hypothetical protein